MTHTPTHTHTYTRTRTHTHSPTIGIHLAYGIKLVSCDESAQGLTLLPLDASVHKQSEREEGGGRMANENEETPRVPLRSCRACCLRYCLLTSLYYDGDIA